MKSIRVDLSDPALEVFAERRDRILKSRKQIVVDSPKVVTKLLESEHTVESILATEGFIEDHSSLLAQRKNLTVYQADRPVMESIVGHQLHHGVIALAQRPADKPLLNMTGSVLVLNGVNKSENVGTIIRTADALGITNVIVEDQAVSPYSRRSIRVSMGSIFRMNVYHSQNLRDDLLLLKEREYSLVGTGLYAECQAVGEVRWHDPTVLVIGSEGFGMAEEVKEICDLLIRIPIRQGVDSLNAAVAAGICMYAWKG